MKKALAITSLLVASHFSHAKEVIGENYKFNIPENVTFTGHGKLDMYTFKWGGSIPETMSLHKQPVSTSQKVLTPMMNMMEITMEEQFNKFAIYSKISKSITTQFTVTACRRL